MWGEFYSSPDRTSARNADHSEVGNDRCPAARELGIAPRTLRQWARQGRIRFITDPNGWRFFRVGDVYTLRDARRETR